MQVIIKCSNLARFNVYFDEHGMRASCFDMIEQAGLGWLFCLCSNYDCSNFEHCVHSTNYTASQRRHQAIDYNDT